MTATLLNPRLRLFAPLLIFLMSVHPADSGPFNATPPRDSIAWVLDAYPDKVERFLTRELNLTHPGLERVKAAVEARDWASACEALLDYYREGDSIARWRMKPVAPSDRTHAAADAICANAFTFQNKTVQISADKRGRLDWQPINDAEWLSFLNRHVFLRDLLIGYRETGNPAYPAKASELIVDWFESHPYEDDTYRWAWHDLQPGARMLLWPRAFYEWQRVDAFTPAARLIMLMSLPDHAHFMLKFNRATYSNKLAIYMSGLVNLACAWPELRGLDGRQDWNTPAAQWISIAIKRVEDGLARQFYPDGAQRELTALYHLVTIERFQAIADMLAEADQPVPPLLSAQLEQAWHYLAMVMRPDGTLPLNNDADLRSVRRAIIQMADQYERPDWLYIASNGKRGQVPSGLPSHAFAWTGQLLMRSGYASDAHWAMFDFGPLGMPDWHSHLDKLHLSVAAFGRNLLVDAGRFSYQSADKAFFRGTAAHNTIMIDGQNQAFQPHDRQTTTPLTRWASVHPEGDWALGVHRSGYEGVEDAVVHTRAVEYVRGRFWVVVDRVEMGEPHRIETLWHFDPTCTVTRSGESVYSDDSSRGNLRIIPASGFRWQVELIKGAMNPMQGWHSPDYNVKLPGTCAIYRTDARESQTFAWVLWPTNGTPPDVSAKLIEVGDDLVRVQIQPASAEPFVVQVPMSPVK